MRPPVVLTNDTFAATSSCKVTGSIRYAFAVGVDQATLIPENHLSKRTERSMTLHTFALEIKSIAMSGDELRMIWDKQPSFRV